MIQAFHLFANEHRISRIHTNQLYEMAFQQTTRDGQLNDGVQNPATTGQGMTGQGMTGTNLPGQGMAGQGITGQGVSAGGRSAGGLVGDRQIGAQGMTNQVGQPMEFTRVATQESSQQVCFNIPSTVEVPAEFVETVRIPQPGALRKDGVSSAVEEEARRLREQGLSEELVAATETFREAERARANAAFIQAEADAVSKASLAGLTALEKQRMATAQAHTLLARAQAEKDALLEASRLEAEAAIENAANLKLMREKEALRRTEELMAVGTGTPGVRFEVREVPLREGEVFEGIQNRSVLQADASKVGSTLAQAARDQPPTGRMATARQMQYEGAGPLGQGGVEQITGHGPVSRLAEGAAVGGTGAGIGSGVGDVGPGANMARNLSGTSDSSSDVGVPRTGLNNTTDYNGPDYSNPAGDYNPSTGAGGNMGVLSGQNTATDNIPGSGVDSYGNPTGVDDGTTGKKPGFIAKVKNFVERKL